MERTLRLISCGALLILMIGVVGCRSTRRYEDKDFQEPRPAPVHPGTEHPVAPPPREGDEATIESRTLLGREASARKTLRDSPVVRPDAEWKGALSDVEKQRIVEQALLNVQRIVISSKENMYLTGGIESTSVAREVLETKLAELGFNVVAMTSKLDHTPSKSELDAFGRMHDCNLVVLMKGEARKLDAIGGLHMYESKLKGKVMNLSRHQVIASRGFDMRGDHARSERKAAEDSLEKAAESLATYLTDEAARKWEDLILIKTRVKITGLDHAEKADDCRVGLQRRSGIYYVSLESWDRDSKIAIYEILCRFDVQRFLVGYVEELRVGRVRIEDLGQHGSKIHAIERRRD